MPTPQPARIQSASAFSTQRTPPYEGISLSLNFLCPHGACQSVNVTPSQSSRCGSGGFGNVYSCQTQANGVWVIKIPISKYDKSIREEISNLHKLQKLDPTGIYHNPIVGTVEYNKQVIGFAVAPAHMSLEKAIETKLPGIVELLSGVLDGLTMLHQNAYIHGDVKTTNLLIFKTPSGPFTIKLIDFGTLTRYNPASPIPLLSTYPPPSKCHPPEHGNIKCDAIPYIDQYAWALVCLHVISPQNAPTTYLSYQECGTRSLKKIKSCIEELSKQSKCLSEDDQKIITQSIHFLTLEEQSLMNLTTAPTAPAAPTAQLPSTSGFPHSDMPTPIMDRHPIGGEKHLPSMASCPHLGL